MPFGENGGTPDRSLKAAASMPRPYGHQLNKFLSPCFVTVRPAQMVRQAHHERDSPAYYEGRGSPLILSSDYAGSLDEVGPVEGDERAYGANKGVNVFCSSP